MTHVTTWTVIFLTTLLIFSSAAKEPPTCNVTHQPDGSFLYNLSRPPSSSKCETCWEDKNKTVIVRNNLFAKELVHNVTNQSIILKDCHAYLHYTENCLEGWEHAHCNINCSRIENLPPATVNQTLICITESWCVTRLIFGLGVAGIFLLVVIILVVLQRCNICRCRRRESVAMRASYTPANGQFNMEQDEVMVVKIQA